MRALGLPVAMVLIGFVETSCGGGGTSAADGGLDGRPVADGGTDTSLPVAAGWADYCEKESRRQMACGGMPFQGACVEQGQCVMSVALPELVEPLTRCLLARACTDGDDECYSQIAAMGESRPLARSTITACVDRFETCPDAMVGLDVCAGLGMTTEAFLRETAGCVAQSCDGADDCMLALLTRSKCN